MHLNLKTAPANPAVTLADAKAHLRVAHTDDDALIMQQIENAVDWVETEYGISLVNRTYELGLDGFSDCMALLRPPVSSVTSIAYLDSDGNSQTLGTSNYVAQLWGMLPFIKPASGETYPATLEHPHAVVIEYVAGFGADDTAMKGAIREALLLLVGHFYENREANIVGMVTAELKFTVEHLMQPYRNMQGMG